ncbi:MAG: hypothetical protein MUC99_04145 [Anaerolineae bacterium]|nr:hypothetical protein [Anaerolineae bacterium]
MTDYHLPTLTLPFAVQANPSVAAAERHTADWLRYFDLIKSSAANKKFEAAKFWVLSSAAYPQASADDLLMINDWIAWLFIQDDFFDEARVGRQSRRMQAYVEAALGVLRQSRLATVRDDGALLAGLSELWQRMRTRMDADLAARFVMAFESYTTACLWELENRSYGYAPTEGEYVLMRRDTSGFRPCAVLIEMSLGVAMPTRSREHPVVRRMTDLTNDVLSWTNDLFSSTKEASRNDMHNLVLILAQQMPLPQAMALVAERIQNAVTEFVSLSEALPATSGEADGLTQRYVDGLKHWMAANLHWSIETGRYVAKPADAGQDYDASRLIG